MRCPLRVCVGAANTVPDEHTLAAFADRFLARLFVEPVPDARLEELLETGWTSVGTRRLTTRRFSVPWIGWRTRRPDAIFPMRVQH